MPSDQGELPSDAELTAHLRDEDSDAAAEELYRRHRSAVLAYAYTCCRDPHTAEDLTSEAFARALLAVRSGSGPKTAWRPYLLTIVRRTAADWAGTARRTELSADFEQWLANNPEFCEVESGEERILRLEDGALVLRAFRSLPERWQAVLWHTAVEGEAAQTVGTMLGIGATGVTSLAARAREGLREAYLAAHAENSAGTDECRHYRSLLGAVVRRTGRRRTKDFDRHVSRCGHCRSALIEVTDLNERLGSVLSTRVLLWGGSAYAAARLAEAGAGAAAGSTIAFAGPDGAAHLHGSTGLGAKTGGLPFRSAAAVGSVGVAIAITILVLPMPFGQHEERAAPAPTSSPSSSSSPSPSPSPTPSFSTSPSSTSSLPSSLPSASLSSPARQPTTAGQAPDGTNSSPCFDGTCEIEVKGGDVIRLDGRAGVDEFKVVSVADNTLAFQTSSANGAQQSSGSMTSPGRSMINQLVVDLVSINGGRALIRLRTS